MNSALSPREIQSRLRAGASIPEVAAEAGVDVERISGFALPIMAERAHVTRAALDATVRRRGDSSGHRRLRELVRDRLQARSLDADAVEWDAWRQNDLKWRLVGLLDDQVASRAAEFIFDPKGRFSVADNADARWMIGEQLPGTGKDPDNENTIDFNDELALFRAVSESPAATAASRPGDDVPVADSPYEGAAHTSELDELYDMLSGVSEDSVRVYLEFDEPEGPGDVVSATESTIDPTEQDRSTTDSRQDTPAAAETPAEEPHTEPARLDDASEAPRPSHENAPLHQAPARPEQDPLVPDTEPGPPARKPTKKRASIPSWDEIMFGGPGRG